MSCILSCTGKACRSVPLVGYSSPEQPSTEGSDQARGQPGCQRGSRHCINSCIEGIGSARLQSQFPDKPELIMDYSRPIGIAMYSGH